MIICTMKPDDITQVLDHVLSTPHAPRGLNSSYLWEIAHFTFTDVIFTRLNGKIRDVAYKYSLGEETFLEEWTLTGGFFELASAVAKQVSDSLVVSVSDEASAVAQKLPKVDESLEMHLHAGGATSASDCYTPLTVSMREGAVALMASEWYPGELAKSFVDVLLSNPHAKTNILISNSRVLGLAHGCYAGGTAWVNALYVDSACRGRGFGRLLLSGLVSELISLGVEDIFIGVDKSNAGAFRLYKALGFSLTPFRKMQFGWR